VRRTLLFDVQCYVKAWLIGLHLIAMARWPASCCRAMLCSSSSQSHRLERVVPTYVPAGVRSRGIVAAMFCPSGCDAVVHSQSMALVVVVVV